MPLVAVQRNCPIQKDRTTISTQDHIHSHLLISSGIFFFFFLFPHTERLIEAEIFVCKNTPNLENGGEKTAFTFRKQDYIHGVRGEADKHRFSCPLFSCFL